MESLQLPTELRQRLAVQLRRACDELSREDAGAEALAIARNSAAAALLLIDVLQLAPAPRPAPARR